MTAAAHLADGPGNDALPLTSRLTLHCVGLASTCLAIAEQAHLQHVMPTLQLSLLLMPCLLLNGPFQICVRIVRCKGLLKYDHHALTKQMLKPWPW